jgi:chromosome segregation ATPase
MTTLNKVLAVLNGLAAIAFLCVAGLDYGARQAWMFAVLQQDFILRGLPVDAKETDVDGRPLVQSIGKRMQDQLFAGLSGPKLKTQSAEVERRKTALRTEIDGAANPEAKKKIIAAALVPLARTWGQRDELQRKIHDPKVSVDDLLDANGPFETAFKEATDQSRGQEERRQAIAHLLFNLGDNPDDHRRALAIVGLKAYNQEVDSQATALADMVPQIQHALEADLTAFEVEHKDLVRQIVVLADQVRQLNETLKKQTLLAQDHAAQVAAREGDVKTVRAEIEKAKKAAALADQGQSRLEDALFRARQAIAAAGGKNQQLLRQLTTLELSR